MAECVLSACRRGAFTKQYKTHPGSKSKIWKYFGFLSDSDGIVKVTLDEAICELCNERIKCLNNTTNLLTHLKQHHSIEYDEIISEIRNEDVQESHSSPVVENTTSSTKTKQQSLPDIISKKEPYRRIAPGIKRAKMHLFPSCVTIYNPSVLLIAQLFANCCTP